ncbi:MAG: SRPBCC family protein [Gemmataceae bacterium]|nr:SRPBCC family protein [Gemmataceae bacterium]
MPILLNMQAIAVPRFVHEARFSAPPEAIFALLAAVSRRPEWTPSKMHLELVEGAEALAISSVCQWKVRRGGISQRIVTTFETVEPPSRIVERQIEGPFPLWRHETQLAADGQTTIVQDVIEFQPPGGMLGFIVTEKRIQADLHEAFGYRDEQWRRLLS